MRLRAWWTRVRGSLRKDDALEREMAQEMEFHVDMATMRNVERGMTARGARREAKLAFGSADAFREAAREAQRARGVENVIADMRFALRSLRRSPSFTAAAVLSVALGMGASTAMFSVVSAVLLRPLPIPRPDDFMYVGWIWSKGDYIPALTSFQYEFVRDRSRIFEAVSTYRTEETHLGDESAAQPLRGLHVSSGFFRTIGFTPRLGRAFDAAELEPGGPAVVILGDDVWRARFGADPDVLGRKIRLDGEPRTVVGVMPPEFRFPPATRNTGFLVPLAVRGDPADEGHNSDVIARVRHGTSVSARAAEMRELSAAFRTAYPSLAADGESFDLYTHTDVHVGSAARHTLWLLFGACTLVLLIACANTATLLLVRASARQREIAVRSSIGAGPGRILQQVLTEGLVLAVVAAAFGVLISMIAVRGFLAGMPRPSANTPHGALTTLPADLGSMADGRVLAWAMIVTLVTGVLFGFATAVPAYRKRLQSVLVSGTRGTTAGNTRLRYALVFIQTAVAVLLLAGATLLTASFARLIRVDPGFDADRVIAVKLGRLPPEYDDAARRDLLVNRLLQRMRALPGVEYAAVAPNLPLERGVNFPVDIAERPDLAIGAVELRFVSTDYFATLGIAMRGGRDFDEHDVAGTEPVAIVNETFARHFWDDASPIGRTIQIGHFRDRWQYGPGHQTRVIGVVADIHELGLHRAARPTVLLPRAQTEWGTPLLLVRGTSPALLAALRGEVAAEERQLTPEVERLSAVVSRSVAEPRFRTLLVVTFAAFALLLAAIGICGVIAAVVQHRWREIGIRLALGANRTSVATAVVRRCLASVIAGTLAGLLVFWTTRSVLSAWLYDITPGNPATLSATIAVILLVAALASWIPARRATRIDPATSLRLE
jgi:predicted permease